MIAPTPRWQGRTAAVLGLGASGRSACRALHGGRRAGLGLGRRPERGAALPAAPACRSSTSRSATGAGSTAGAAPGIPLTHPSRTRRSPRAAKPACGSSATSSCWSRTSRERRIVGITGTNGKSTTTALIGTPARRTPGAMRRSAAISARRCWIYGLDRPTASMCLELSSYQLELTERLRSDVAVLPQHHAPTTSTGTATWTGYVAAKRRILRNQRRATAVVGIDDAHCRGIAERARQRRPAAGPADLGRPQPGARRLRDRRPADRRRRRPGRPRSPTCARSRSCPARTTGRTPPRPMPPRGRSASRRRRSPAASRRFRASPIAWSWSATLDGVQLRQRLQGHQPRCGGEGAGAATTRSTGSPAGCRRPAGLTPLLPWFDRVRHAYLIGEAAEEFATTLGRRVACTRCGDLATALAAATAAARREPRRRGRAAVAGLRLLRPVPQFRSARRHVPGAGREARGAGAGAPRA